ncbi:MAG: sulfotransferase family protein [Deltaproteobacteria bacterium]|nr:sulfotransferase family protein [Deltaproteobacteria bacterium]
MALLLKNGSIFLHIPKTGGNWVREILSKLDLVDKEIGHKHADVDRVLYDRIVNLSFMEFFKKKFSKSLTPFRNSQYPFIFCFVRHPLQWYESWFKYMSQPNREWRNWPKRIGDFDWHPNSLINGTGSNDFKQFVKNVLKLYPGYVTHLYGFYTKREIDFIGKQENLRNDLINVLNIMKLNFDKDLIIEYERVGVSPKPRTPMIWDIELRNKVIQVEYSGLLRYGYLGGQRQNTAGLPKDE